MSLERSGMAYDWLRTNCILREGLMEELTAPLSICVGKRMSKPFGTYKECQQRMDWEWFLDNKDAPYKKEVYKRWKERRELNAKMV